MWASGDYPHMVETFLLRLGPRDLDDALNAFCDEWNLGTPDQARFEQEYIVAVGTRA
jgi:hypothetical protein